MDGYENFYSAVMPDLAKHYEISEYDFLHNRGYKNVIKARSHFHSIALIEFYLEEHRQSNRHSIIEIDGVKALHHLVFLKTKWKPSEIEQLTQDDLLFVLLDDLIPERLSESAQLYLETISNGSSLLKIDLTTYAGWDLGSGGQYLR